jgi:hypothetical protein
VTTRQTRAAATGLALAIGLAPRAALACAACLSSAYGDRSFNWAYGALMAAPFLTTVAIGAVLAWKAGYRLQWRASLRAPTVIAPIRANEERS